MIRFRCHCHRLIQLATLLALPGAALSLRGEAPVKHLYLANDTHTDLMWNGDEEAWYQRNLEMARFYLKLGEDTRGEPPEARSKWNYDVAWTLYMMEQRESPEFFQRIIAQIKNGQASVPYNFTLPVYGGSTLEAVLRGFYYSGSLARRHGLEVAIAVCQENATVPLGLASLWAGSGAKYSWKGVCNCASPINNVGPRDHEIYWYTGLDGSRVLMKWYSNSGWNAELGGYSELLEPTVAVRQLNELCGTDRYPYLIAGAFGKGWDNMHNYSYDLTMGLRHRTLPGTKLHLSDELDFFRHFEATYGSVLPLASVAYGNDWELGFASLAEVNGQLRRSLEKLRTAESLMALTVDPARTKLRAFDAKKRDFLYALGVHNVHGWTADGPISRHDFATYMRRQQQRVTDYADTLLRSGLEEMGRRIDARGRRDLVLVFNPLNWERSALVDIPLSGDFDGVRDEAGDGPPRRGTLVDTETGKVLRVRVDGVPAVGYRVVQLVKAPPAAAPKPVFSLLGGKVETPFYTAEIAPNGSLRSLVDRRTGKEWAKGALNQLGQGSPAAGGPPRVESQGADFITIRCDSDQPVAHTTWITFHAADPRIDFRNVIRENFASMLHYTFAFNVSRPETWHEEVGAVIKARLASAGGHYADRMARYDYLSLNHFVDVGNATEGVTLSNADALFFRLGESDPGWLDMDAATIHVLAGGQVNQAKNLGVIAQDGDALFQHHFSILPRGGGFDATRSMRLALEHQNPLAPGSVQGGGAPAWPASAHSFLSCASADLILWTLKPGEDDGIVARFWNLGAAPTESTVSFDRPITRAAQATHVETDIAEIPHAGKAMTVRLQQQQLGTFHLTLQ